MSVRLSVGSFILCGSHPGTQGVAKTPLDNQAKKKCFFIKYLVYNFSKRTNERTNKMAVEAAANDRDYL